MKSKKYSKNINPIVLSSINVKVMILSKCAICGSKESRFIKNQELFTFEVQLHWMYKMNEIVNKFLLAGDKLCLKCI